MASGPVMMRPLIADVVAHDRYDDVIRRANEPDSIVQVKSVIIGVLRASLPSR